MQPIGHPVVKKNVEQWYTMSSRSCATQNFIIQKVTFLSFDVAKTMAHFKRIFEKDIKEIPGQVPEETWHSVVDVSKKRNSHPRVPLHK